MKHLTCYQSLRFRSHETNLRIPDAVTYLQTSTRLVILISVIIYLSVLNPSIGNDVRISNLDLKTKDVTSGANHADNNVYIYFDVRWDNSWRNHINWDAIWIFMKYRLAESDWKHASLSATGHIAPAGGIIEPGINEQNSDYAVGVFLYRSVAGSGDISWYSVGLRWNYGKDGVKDNVQVHTNLFGIEMVYIPRAEFDLGDGTTTDLNRQFHNAKDVTKPLRVTGENEITLGGQLEGSLGNNDNSGMSVTGLDDFSIENSQLLPPGFPKGYEAFYCMKYEMSQQQYVDFLNTLTYDQQASRTALPPNSADGTKVNDRFYRNGLTVMLAGMDNSQSAVYSSDLNEDGIFGDGDNIAANFLNWGDAAAYMDWAGLRPMTELEFEKACLEVYPQ